MRKKFIRFFDYIFVLRPMLFFPGWSTLLAGFFVGQKQRLYLNFTQINALNNEYIILLLVIFALAMSASFLLNQLQDIESDRQNKKLFIIAEGHISRQAAVIEISLLILLALIFSFTLSQFVGWLTLIFILLTGYIYNYPPFRFKDYPIRSLLANAAMGWLAYAIGWAAGRPFNYQLFIDALPYLFFNTALYLYTTLPDREGDVKTGKNTLAAVMGLNTFLSLAFLFYAAGLSSAIFLKDFTALFFMLLSAPFFVLTLWNKTVSSATSTTKFAILFFALAICFKWPFYFILMVAGFYFTKLYFRLRFDFDYPNFRGG